jgi:phosphoribosyl 1,2-cyclic phosphate phosphodiesterase
MEHSTLMQLQFLGTSASEGYPDAFCDCDNCQRARVLGGFNLRKRSSVLIDGELLIDLGPDLMAASMQHNVSLAQIRYCLQTHEHSDHLDPSHFHSRSAYCGVYGNPRLHYYASIGALARIAGSMSRVLTVADLFTFEISDRFNLTICCIEPFQKIEIGPYQVFSMAANHAPETTAMLYLIERDGRTLFYGTDTGELPQSTWDALEAHGRPCNVVVLDHTFGMKGRSNGHMNHEQFLEQVDQFRSLGLLAADARIYATHLAHHSNPTHEELAAFAAKRGYIPAYDGLMVEV